jgi:hypothetical protein
LLNHQFHVVKGDTHGQGSGALVKADFHGPWLAFLIRRNAGHSTFSVVGKSVLRQLA